jgi:GntR family transcriptional repressor for pyruvate dehydrogenase complex
MTIAARTRMRTLEAMGIVETMPGPGREPSRILAGQPTAALGNLLRLDLTLSRFPLEDIIDTRVQLERSMAKRAAYGAAAADLARLRDLVEGMSHPGIGQEKFYRLDSEFHMGVAMASHNEFAADLMLALRNSVETEMKVAFASSSNWPDTAMRLASDHQSILAAIQHRHGALAENLISEHITRFYCSAK